MYIRFLKALEIVCFFLVFCALFFASYIGYLLFFTTPPHPATAAATPVPTQSLTPSPPPESSAPESADVDLRLSFVGDLMFDRNVKARMQKYGDEYPFYKITSDDSGPLGGVDAIFGNLEGAISAPRSPQKSIDFSFSDNVPSLLKAHNFTAVSLANNHSLDQGADGYQDTVRALAAAGVGSFGHQVNDNTVAWEAVLKGKKLAMFGYNTTDNAPKESDIKASIAAASKTHDYVVVFMHWGKEYTPLPTDEVRALGRKLVEWGASAVIGSHPHVMQGMEVWQGRPIFWSLGNFVFDQDWSEETQRGLALTLSFGPVQTAVELHPILIKESQPSFLQGTDRRASLKIFAERSNLAPHIASQVASGKLVWGGGGE